MTFQLGGQEFIALSGGPFFAFSPALSRDAQEEMDTLWEKLSEGGEAKVWLAEK